jgi:hypothetical protein
LGKQASGSAAALPCAAFVWVKSHPPPPEDDGEIIISKAGPGPESRRESRTRRERERERLGSLGRRPRTVNDSDERLAAAAAAMIMTWIIMMTPGE